MPGHKRLKSSLFISDIRKYTGGGQDPTVTLQMWHNIQHLVLLCSASPVAVGMSSQVLTLPSLLVVRSSPFDASTAILAVMETSDNRWERGEIKEVRRDYGSCMTESSRSAVFGRCMVTMTNGIIQDCQCHKK
jgi:hypothetical protein